MSHKTFLFPYCKNTTFSTGGVKNDHWAFMIKVVEKLTVPRPYEAEYQWHSCHANALE